MSGIESPISAVVDALDDSVAGDSMKEKNRPIVEIDGLPKSKYSESDFGYSYSGKQFLKKRADPHLDSSSHKHDANRRCIAIKVNNKKISRSRVQTLNLLVKFKNANLQLDEDITKRKNHTENLVVDILKIKEGIDDMKWKIKMDVSEIELLEHEVALQVAEVEKITPGVKTVSKVKTCIIEIQSINKSLAARLAKATEWMAECKMKKDQIKVLNDYKWEIANISIKKWKVRFKMEKDNFEKEMNNLVEDIMEYEDVAQQLEKHVKHLLKNRDSKVNKVRQLHEHIEFLLEEKKDIKGKRVISIAENKTINEKISSLERDIAMWARGKLFNFVPKISFVHEIDFEDKDTIRSQSDTKGHNFSSIHSMICDLSMRNSSLKKELSKVTSKLLKLMLNDSVMDETKVSI